MRAWLAILLVAGASRHASSQNANDEAIALALFNEGKAFAAAGDIERACPKFEAADRLTGWLGVELNLADCYERTGRTASAWVLFRKAADKATATGDDRATYARTRAATLEPVLARLTITSAVAPLEIRIDRVVLSGDDLGGGIPIDPGDHRIEARMPGASEVWSHVVTVAPRALVSVQIPVPVHVEPPVKTPPPSSRERPWLAWIIGATGTALVGTAAGLGLSAKLHYDAAVDEHCDAHRVCGTEGLAGIATARERANAATIVGGFGITLAAAGLVLYLAARSNDDRGAGGAAISVMPVATTDTMGVAIGGTL
jgi:hypothetical protein